MIGNLISKEGEQQEEGFKNGWEAYHGYKSCNNEVTIKSGALVVFVEQEDESIQQSTNTAQMINMGTFSRIHTFY